MSQFDLQPDPNRDEEASINPEQVPDDELALETTSERLQYVEDLLRHAPLLSVPVGFAERVVAALRGKDTDDPDYRDAVGLVLGLLVSGVITVVMLGIPAYLMITAILTGNASTFVPDIIEFLSIFVVGWMSNIPLIAMPLVGTLGLTIIALMGYVFWFMKGLLSSDN